MIKYPNNSLQMEGIQIIKHSISLHYNNKFCRALGYRNFYDNKPTQKFLDS